MKRIAIAIAALLLPSAALAAPDLPQLQGEPVVDAANVLPDDQERALDAKLTQIEKSTGRQLVVATVPSLDGDAIDDYAHLVFRKWMIGRATLNDGILLLVAPTEKKVRIQTGAGMGPYLTDADSSLIIQEKILPRFKAKDIAGGIVAGVDAIAPLITPDAITRKQEQAKLDNARRQRTARTVDTFLSWLGIFILSGGLAFGGWFVATAKRRRERRAEREAQARREREDALRTSREQSPGSFHVGSYGRTTDDPNAADAAVLGAAAYEASRRSTPTPTWTPTPTPTWTPTPTPAPTPSWNSDDDDSSRRSSSWGSSDPDPTPTPTPSDDFTPGGGTDDGGGATGSWS